jgi:hypothetical protein
MGPSLQPFWVQVVNLQLARPRRSSRRLQSLVHKELEQASNCRYVTSLTPCRIRLTMLAMKQCPECSAHYDDNVKFCAKDGRSLQMTAAAPSRLCPHCANSIAEEATSCPYCKASVAEEPAPEWLIRDERAVEPRLARRGNSTMSKIMLAAGIALCLVATGLFATGIFAKGDSAAVRQLLEKKVKELESKAEQVKALETELAQARQEGDTRVKEGEALKARLEESEKGRAAAEARLGIVQRNLEQRSARPAQTQPKNEPRLPAPAPARSARRSADPGVY